MIPKLVINFVTQYPLPSGGFMVSYRPKGSLQPYYTITQLTGSPFIITAHILANVDYEGFIQSVCGTELSSIRTFTTSNYSNSIGNINIEPCTLFSYTEGITSISFANIELLPLGNSLPLIPGQSGAFVSNVQGIGDIVITHDLSDGLLIVKDSAGFTFTQNITPSPITLNGVIINATHRFSISVICSISPVSTTRIFDNSFNTPFN